MNDDHDRLLSDTGEKFIVCPEPGLD